MADIVYGQPVQTGDRNATGFTVVLTGTRGDGTRRVTDQRTHTVGQNGMVHAPQNGYIPSKGVRQLQITDAQFREEGVWLSFLNEDGFAVWVDEAVTPGDAFYKFRDILSHHAHRFVVEHNPSNLRYTNTDERRIEHLSHELSNQDRMRAGNVSSLVRPNIGHLWERIHKFVLMPAEEDWKTERDALKVFIEEHLCAVCEGAGLSYRLMADHPREEWKGWLDAELRFTVDRDLNASPMSGKVVTPEVVRADMNNFRNALAFHGKGLPDLDYGGNGRAVASVSEAAPSSKTLPYPEEDTLERMALLAFWSRQYRLFDGSGLTGLAQPVWRNWCWMNCAAVLEGWRNPVVSGGITTNKGLTITRFGEMAQVMRATQQPYLTLMRDRFIRSPWDIPFTIIESNQAFRTFPGPDIYFVPRPGGNAEVEPANALARTIDKIIGDITTPLS